jgi:hypothetical protein
VINKSNIKSKTPSTVTFIHVKIYLNDVVGRAHLLYTILWGYTCYHKCRHWVHLNVVFRIFAFDFRVYGQEQSSKLNRIKIRCLFDCFTTLQSWRWRQYIPPKHWETSVKVHRFISRKTVLFRPGTVWREWTRSTNYIYRWIIDQWTVTVTDLVSVSEREWDLQIKCN